MELHAYIHVYSSEVFKRRLAIRFHAVGGTTPAAPALSIAVNMSRTPNSRKSLVSKGVSTGGVRKRPCVEPVPRPPRRPTRSL